VRDGAGYVWMEGADWGSQHINEIQRVAVTVAGG
jgi:hypothetical protein